MTSLFIPSPSVINPRIDTELIGKSMTESDKKQTKNTMSSKNRKNRKDENISNNGAICDIHKWSK